MMNRLRAYWAYMRSPKGAYEWRYYALAILSWIGISLLVMGVWRWME